MNIVYINKGRVVRKFLDEMYNAYATQKLTERIGSAWQVLKHTQDMESNNQNEALKGLTLASALEAAKSWEHDGDLVREHLKALYYINVPEQEESKRWFISAKHVFEKAREMAPDNEALKRLTPESALEAAKGWEHDGDLVKEHLKIMYQINVPKKRRLIGAKQVFEKAREMAPDNEALKGLTPESVLEDAKSWV